MNQMRDSRTNRKNMFSPNEPMNIAPPLLYQGGYRNVPPPQHVKVGLNVAPSTASKFRCMSVQDSSAKFHRNVSNNANLNVTRPMPMVVKPPPKNIPQTFSKHKDYACIQNQIMKSYAIHKHNIQNQNNVMNEENTNSKIGANKLQLKINGGGNNPEKISINSVISKPNTAKVPCLKYKGGNCDINIGWWNFQEKSSLYKNFEKYKKNIKKKYAETRQVCNNRSAILMNNNSNKVFPNEYFYIPATNKNFFRSKSKAKVKSQPVSDFHKLNLKPITGFLQSYQKQKEKDQNPKPSVIKVSRHPMILEDYPNVYKENKKMHFPFELGKAEIMMVDDEGENLNNTKGLFVSVNNTANENTQTNKINVNAGTTKGIMVKYKKHPKQNVVTKSENAPPPPKNIQIRLKNREVSNEKKKKTQRKYKSSENSYNSYDVEQESESGNESNESEQQHVRVKYKNRKNNMNKVNLKKYRITSDGSKEYLNSDVSSEEEYDDEENEYQDEQESDDERYENRQKSDDESYEDENEYDDERYEEEYEEEIQSNSSNYSKDKTINRHQIKVKKKNYDERSHANMKKNYANDRRRHSSSVSSPHFHDHRNHYNSKTSSEFERYENKVSSIENSNCSDEGEEYIEKSDMYENKKRHPTSRRANNKPREVVYTKMKKQFNDSKRNTNKSTIRKRPSYINSHTNENSYMNKNSHMNENIETFDTKHNSENGFHTTNNSSSSSEKHREYSKSKQLSSYASQTDYRKQRSSNKKINYTRRKSSKKKSTKSRYDDYSDSGNSCIETYMRKKNSYTEINDSEDSTEPYWNNQKSREEIRKPKVKDSIIRSSCSVFTDSRRFKPNTDASRSRGTSRMWNNQSSKKSNDDYLEKVYEDVFNDTD